MKEILDNYKKYLEARNISLVYYTYIRIWLNYCNQKNIDYKIITQDIITNFFNTKNYKPETKNLFMTSAKNFYSFLELKSEWDNMKHIKVEQRIPEYLIYDDIKKLERYLVTHSTRILPQKAIAIIYFMFFTGIRKKELLELARKNFDFEKNEVKIYQNKSKKEIILPLADEAKKKIKEYFNLENEGSNAFNITLSQINYLFRVKASYYLGRKIKPHLTRHGAGRYMHEKGVPLKDIQDVLGHANIITTMRYTQHTTEDRNKIIKDKINKN